MILYIIRHGDPDYEHNTITEFGRREAEALGEYMKTVKLDKIYTSPLGRAIDTALPTCKAKNIDYEILDWTAESMAYMRPIDRAENCGYMWNAKDGVTSFDDFTTEDREAKPSFLVAHSDAFLADLGYIREGWRYRVVKENDDSIAVFCHGGFGSAWISHLMSKPCEFGFTQIRLRTSSITEFQFENLEKYTLPHLYALGATPHMTLAGLPLGKR